MYTMTLPARSLLVRRPVPNRHITGQGHFRTPQRKVSR